MGTPEVGLHDEGLVQYDDLSSNVWQCKKNLRMRILLHDNDILLQFLLRMEDLGKRRAETLLPRLQQLAKSHLRNVTIRVVKGRITEEIVQKYTVRPESLLSSD